MSHADDVIHQWGPPGFSGEGAAGSDGGVEEGEGAERGKKAGWGLNGAAGDNDRAVGFDDGSKWVSGEYECDI